MAATWVVLGSEGIREFITLRERAIKDILTSRENLPSSEGLDRDLINTMGDHFHNGIEVLPEVTKWHNFLRMSVRQSDTITCQVLRLVDAHMLRGRPEQRMTASQICTELKRIKDEEHEKHQEEPAESVMTWDELPGCDPAAFTVDTVPARFADVGDPWAGMDSAAGSLESLLEQAARDEAAGLPDAPWPPHYVKQAGEAPRVQPSKRRN